MGIECIKLGDSWKCAPEVALTDEFMWGGKCSITIKYNDAMVPQMNPMDGVMWPFQKRMILYGIGETGVDP